MRKENLPTIKEKNLFWAQSMIALPIGIISGLFAGFTVKIINFKNGAFDFIIFLVLGLILFFGQYLMFKMITPVVGKSK